MRRPIRTRTSKLHRIEPDPAAQRLGARIRELRKADNWSFDAWTEELGFGRGYVSELERGLVVPSFRVLLKVAEALQLTLADLVIGNSLREQLFEASRTLTEEQLLILLEQAQEFVLPNEKK